MPELFEKLNEKQKRMVIAYATALLGDEESEDEGKEERENGAFQE